METTPLPSTRVLGGRYTLGPVIGRGGMAEVHRAYDSRLGREVAVKLFRPEVAEARDLRRVRSEIRTLAGLNHPALVTLHDAADGDDGSPAYLVLELVDGRDLADLIRADELDTDDVIDLIAEVGSALAYIHSRGIVHRDIKPENILVYRDDDGDLRAKLADLGIARIVDESHLTGTGSIIGTAAYLSPEQVMGDRVTTAADIYALGLVLIEALTGEQAFPGARMEAAIQRTVRDPELPDGLDDEDEDLLARMTSRDPSERPSAAQMVRELVEWTSLEDYRLEPSDHDRLGGAAVPLSASASVLAAEDATERLNDDGATRVFESTPHPPTSATQVLGVADQTAATRVFEAQNPTAATQVFGAPEQTASPAAPTERLSTAPAQPQPEQRRPEQQWPPAPDTEQGPAPHDRPTAPPTARDQRRALVRRRLTVGAIVFALVSAVSVPLWPALTAAIAAPVPPAPAYPGVEGELGGRLTTLQQSTAAGGLSYSAQERLQNEVLAATTAAAAGDLATTSANIDAAAITVDLAVIADQVTGARYDHLRNSLSLVRTALSAAIVSQQEAEAAEQERLRLEEEQRRLDEQAELERLQQLEEEQREQEQLEQEQQEESGLDGVRDQFDQFGRDLQEQWDSWFSGE